MRQFSIRVIAALGLAVSALAPAGAWAGDSAQERLLDRFLGAWTAQVTIEPGGAVPQGSQVTERFRADRVFDGEFLQIDIVGADHRARQTRRFNERQNQYEMWIADTRNEFSYWVGDWREQEQSFVWSLINPALAGQIIERFQGDLVVSAFRFTTHDGDPVLTGSVTARRQ